MKVDSNVNQILSASVKGIERGFEGVNEIAAEIASTNVDDSRTPKDYSANAVALLEYRNQVQASAKAFETAQDAIESVISDLR
ncbi:MAG: hypothetical protein AAF438_17030 [Pseudomonadota bacterium]